MITNFIELQNEIIKKVVDILESYDEIEGMFLIGSHAVNEASSFSDIDMICVFREGNKSKREEIFDKVADVSPVLSKLWLFNKSGLFLYENGVRLDLDFLVESDLVNWGFYKTKILFDPDNKYKKRAEEDKNKKDVVEKPKWREEDGDIIDWFFWMFRQSYCYTRRGVTNPERGFRKLYSAQDSLRQIRDKLLEFSKYLEINEIDFVTEITKTFVRLEPNELTRAIRDLFEIFIDLGKKYCDKEGKKFPEQKAMIMRKLFDEFDRVDF